jgi:hypothetical protein
MSKKIQKIKVNSTFKICQKNEEEDQSFEEDTIENKCDEIENNDISSEEYN